MVFLAVGVLLLGGVVVSAAPSGTLKQAIH